MKLHQPVLENNFFVILWDGFLITLAISLMVYYDAGCEGKMIEFTVAEEQDYEGIRGLISMFPDDLLQTHLPGYSDFFVAKQENRIVGCCACEIFYKPGEENPRLAEIRSLAVHPEFQKKRIGGRLIELCLKRAESCRVYEVFAFSSAIALFERHGLTTFNGAKYALFKVIGNGKK